MNRYVVTLAGRLLAGEAAEGVEGVPVRGAAEGRALLLLVENSPRHADGDLVAALARLRAAGGDPEEAARELLLADLVAPEGGAEPVHLQDDPHSGRPAAVHLQDDPLRDRASPVHRDDPHSGQAGGAGKEGAAGAATGKGEGGKGMNKFGKHNNGNGNGNKNLGLRVYAAIDGGKEKPYFIDVGRAWVKEGKQVSVALDMFPVSAELFIDTDLPIPQGALGVSAPIEYAEGKTRWVRVGIAFGRKEGKGLKVILNAVPKSFSLLVHLEPKPKAEAEGEATEEAPAAEAEEVPEDAFFG